MLQGIDKNASYVHNIIIDDAIYIMRKEYFKRAKETGYGKYTELAMHFQQIISTIESMREDINVFLILLAYISSIILSVIRSLLLPTLI